MSNLPSPVEDALLAEEDVTLEPAASGSDCNFMVLGVGAAAGGLEAFTELLRALPQDVGVAVVFVHHPLDGREQGLAQQLAAHTAMTVVAVTGPTALAPGHLYVAADGAALTVTDRVLTPTAPPAGSTSGNPVDTFFTSLARAVENCAVGVVLSGSGSDGVLGLREIKGVGGITIAQDPDSAHYDSMPRAAIATGAVDLVLTPQRIAEELQRIGRHPYVRQSAPRRPTDDLVIQPEQLHRIFTMLRNGSGVDFTHYKPPTIRRRLQRRMVLQKLDSVEHYIRFMRENPDEITKLYQDLLIHVTRFFRDPDSFRALCTEVFPKIMLNRRSAHPIRIWLPGCSTGEEAYSVAIALLEHLGEDASAVQVQIFATDVSETAIEQARNGLYPDSVAADLTPERLRRFFTKTDGKYRIAKIVRDICVFARQDVTRDPPFSKLDLILCRNVLIYMGAVLQRKLMTVFHYALKPSGFLMLGGAETVGSQAELFAVVDKRHRIFSRKLAESPAHLNLPLEYTPERGPAGRGARVPRETHSGLTFQGEVNRLILDRYGPPGVIVDEDFQIVQFRGKTGAFLEPAPGDVAQSLNLLKMAREGLLHGLQTALFSARKGDKPVRKDGLRVHTHGGIREVNLQVIPFAVPGENRHYLVLFEDTATPGDGVESAPPPVPAPSDDLRVKQLQDELVASREYLQSIIQDLEAANEELQSANEEILSSNEELQSTNEELDTAKEELQSTNEELNTVNEELHGRNEELSRVNSDLVNLLGCVEIAIVIVGADLGIRRFTPMAEKVLNLIPTDIGRPISQIKPNIECPGLERMIARVIDTVTIQESNVRDSEGNWYLLRIRPYKNVENRIDGAVLALFDIAHRRHELELRQAREHTRAILETVREPVLVLDGHLRVQIANRAFCGAFQLPVDAVLHRCIYDLGHGQWDLPALRTLLEDVLQRHARFEHFRVEHEFIGLGRRALVIDACRLDGGDMGATTFILAILDVTGRDAGHGRVGLSS